MKKLVTTLLICGQFMITTQMFGQTTPIEERHAVCGTVSPGVKWEEQFQKQIESFKEERAAHGASSAVITIPVIVHILYKTGQAVGNTPNISAAQVKSQIDFLNEMMAGTDPNKSSLPSAFKSLDGGNTNIQFCLALRDAKGNTLTEPGIERIDLTKKGWSDPSTFTTFDQITGLFDDKVKPATIWDPEKYLNFWTGDFTTKSYYLGYAAFPMGTDLIGLDPADVGTTTAQTDGVVMGSNVFGCKALYANGYYYTEPYIYGVTSAHEVGHWLGLRHISGDEVCGDDYCGDTPVQSGGNKNCANGLNWGCPSYPFQANKCGSGKSPNGEMFQNYMDYSDDKCRSLFTKDQVTRIQTTMAKGERRKTLGTHGLCDNNIAPTATFSADKTSGCGSLTVQFKDESQGTPTSWSWDFGDGSAASTQQNPSHTYAAAGNYDVKLTATNQYGSTPVTKSKFITVGAGSIYTPVKGGPATNTEVGAGAAGTVVRGLLFDVVNPCILQSVKVYATGAGDRTIEVLTGVGGTSVAKKTVTLPDGESRAALGFDLPKGSYFITVSTGTINLYRNTAGAKFPYAIADLINITQTDYKDTDPNYYYYFYDWEVRKSGCDVSNGIDNEKYEDAAVQVYPNPSKGDLTITLPSVASSTDVCIYTIIGENIYKMDAVNNNNKTLTVDLSAQPNGIYFVSVKSGNVITTRKFAIAK